MTANNAIVIHRTPATTTTCPPVSTASHVRAATVVARAPRPAGFTGPAARPSYDGAVPTVTERDDRPVIVGGIVATRRSIRRRGGVTGIGFAVALRVVGIVLGWIAPGTIGGAVSFVFMVLAIPSMPVFGLPAADSGHRMLMAVATSAVAWWFVGQVAAGRVTRSPVVGWRDWVREFVLVGLGLWIGAIGALLIGALALGAF